MAAPQGVVVEDQVVAVGQSQHAVETRARLFPCQVERVLDIDLLADDVVGTRADPGV